MCIRDSLYVGYGTKTEFSTKGGLTAAKLRCWIDVGKYASLVAKKVTNAGVCKMSVMSKSWAYTSVSFLTFLAAKMVYNLTHINPTP